MKILVLFMFLCNVSVYSINLDSLNQYTGWEDKGIYKKQKLQIGPIIYSKLFDKKNKIFTADSNKYFRIWDLETGKILWMMEEKHSNSILFIRDSIIVYLGKSHPDSINYSVLNFNINSNKKTIIKENLLSSNNYKNANIDNFYYFKGDLIGINYVEGSYVSGYNFGTGYYKYNNFDSLALNEHEYQYRFWSDDYSCSSASYDFYWDFKGRDKSRSELHLYKNDNLNMTIDIKNNAGPNCYKEFSPDALYFIYSTQDQNLIISNIMTKYSWKVNLPMMLQGFKSIGDKKLISASQDGTKFIIVNFDNGNYDIIDTSQKTAKYNFLNDKNLVPITTSDRGDIYYFKMSELNKVKADFNVLSDSVPIGDEIKLKNLSSPASTEFEWDFGDGTKSILQNPVKIYTKEGIYDIKLIAFDEERSDTLVIKNAIKIYQNYTPMFRTETYNGKAPLKVTIHHNNYFESDSIKWEIIETKEEFDGDSLVYNFVNPGTYSIKLKCYLEGKEFSNVCSFNIYKSQDSNVTIKNSAYLSGSFKVLGDGKSTSLESFILNDFELMNNSQLSYDYYFKNEIQINNGKYTFQDGNRSYLINFPYSKVYSLSPNAATNKRKSTISAGFDGGVMVRNPVDDNFVVIFDQYGNYKRKLNLLSGYNYYPINNQLLLGINNYQIRFFDRNYNQISSYNFDKIDSFHNLKQINCLFKPDYNQKYDTILIPIAGIDDLLLLKFDKNGNFIKSYYKSGFKFTNIITCDSKVIMAIDSNSNRLYFLNSDLGSISTFNTNLKKFIYLKNGLFLKIENHTSQNTTGYRKLQVSIKKYDDSFISNNICYLPDSLNQISIFTSSDNTIYLVNEHSNIMFSGFEINKIDINLDQVMNNNFIYSIPKDSTIIPKDSTINDRGTFISYPNPSSDFVRINLDTNNFNSVKCYDAIGVEYSINLRQIDSKTYEVDLRALPKGIFTLKIVYPDKAFPVRFIKE